MLQSGAVWWRGDLLQRRRSTPSSVYRVERQDQQPHGTLRGGAMVEVELSWAWACSKIVVVEGIIIQDPSSFSTALLDLPFRTREATGHKAGMKWARGRSWANHRPRMRQRKVQRPNKPQSRSHFSKSRQSLREPATALPTLPCCPCAHAAHAVALLAGATDDASCLLHCCTAAIVLGWR
jgi:hypothetical protein